MSTHYRHPDEIGGGAFLFLFILFIGYAWFLWDGVGNFKTCDAERYPLALVCFPENSSK